MNMIICRNTDSYIRWTGPASANDTSRHRRATRLSVMGLEPQWSPQGFGGMSEVSHEGPGPP